MMDLDKNKAITEYLSEIQAVLKSGDAREHAYRPAFQRLIKALKPEIQVINEPAYTGGNAPDFLFKKGDTPIAYAECKDVTVDIRHKDVQKQANRYVEAFGRILLTNYYEFEILNEEGELVSIAIAEKEGNQINSITGNFERFTNIICDYITPSSRTIRSAKKLAKIMANKARILRDNALASLTENPDSDIYAQYRTFKEVLIRELSEQEFADMYAQTLVYGLFVARYYDPTLPTFSRHEAQDLLPASNPLLKKFFGHVAGVNYDPKIAWLVDSLVEAYLSTNVYELMHKEFVKKQKDPVLHFYETFLSEYDKGLRKNRGVYYTPEPVVSFIVRSVDEILKSKFNLSKGLADTSKIDHEFKLQADDGRRKDGVKRKTDEIHKVQILDPAVGTGTFLNEVIHEIYKSFSGQEGLWPAYVKEHLLPRIHGFELMMASYTMAHLKLGVTLKELGYSGAERLSIWLTNSLEESLHEVPNLFMSQWLTEESHEASRIKSELPIMVVLGNPPYSVSSANKGDSIMDLIQVYKENLNERNIQPLSDDYIKFIRFAENQIEKNGSGIVAMITNNSFIDGITHRQMRKHLMETFDEIYILDLHGSAKKNETDVDGSKDENVFNIQQGVSITFLIKNNKEKNVWHAEIFGSKTKKFNKLDENILSTINWEKLSPKKPYYFFINKTLDSSGTYEKGFSVKDLFTVMNGGIQTKRDALFIDFDRDKLIDRMHILLSGDIPQEFKSKYKIFDSGSYAIESKILGKEFDSKFIRKILYRPFDYRWIYYDPTIISRPANKAMMHMNSGKNLGLITVRQQSTFPFQHSLCTRDIAESGMISLQTKEWGYLFPLYLDFGNEAVPNLNKVIWGEIDEIVGETKPEDIFAYVYSLLNSNKYRNAYKESLKIDFPKIPFPKNKEAFWALVELGSLLYQTHLFEVEEVEDLLTNFPVGGTNIVDNKCPKYKGGNIYLNELQYFGGVPEKVWDFYIGGYQPLQKWLKDRRERELSMEDIEHYQKMIVSINETIKLMGKIDDVFSH